MTQNCIPGGYVCMGFTCHRHETYHGVMDGNRMSLDQVSVCSSARDGAFGYAHPYEPETHSLPPRPASAIPRMLLSEDIHVLTIQIIIYLSCPVLTALIVVGVRLRGIRK